MQFRRVRIFTISCFNLVENFGYTYKTSLDRVLRFCEAKNIRSEGYVPESEHISDNKKGS